MDCRPAEIRTTHGAIVKLNVQTGPIRVCKSVVKRVCVVVCMFVHVSSRRVCACWKGMGLLEWGLHCAVNIMADVA